MMAAFFWGRLQECAARGCPGLSFRAGYLHPRGLCAVFQGQCSACPGAPHRAVRRSCGWKERPLAGKGPWVFKRVQCGSELFPAPDQHWETSNGNLQEEGPESFHYKDKKFSRVCVFSFLLSGQAIETGVCR